MTRLVLLLLFICSNSYCQEIPIIKFADLEKLIDNKDQNIRVINFWATWCAPCVSELPLFEAIPSDQADVVLINLDFADKIDRVKSFVVRKKLTKEVLLLDEIDYNSWIDKVDKTWSGAIPATLFVNSKTGERKFVAKELTEGELQTILSELKD